MQRFPFLRFVALGAVVCSSVGFVACATGSSGDVDIIPGDGGADGSTDDTGGGDTGAGDTGTPTDGGGDTGTTTDGGDGGDTGTVAETGDGGDGSTCAAGCPVGKWDIDGDPLTGECGCEYACVKKGTTDPIDDKFTDDNCDGSDGVVEKCIYVTPSTAGDDSNSGTRVKPMKTITAAIAKAKATGVPAVCLGGGTYTGLVQMESGISLYGGFDESDSTFKFKRSAAATSTLVNAGTVVYAPSVDAETHLEGLTLSATTPTGLGASAYGVRLGGGSATFYVRYNKITVATGTDGDDGVGGSKGSDGAKGPDGKAWNVSSGGSTDPTVSPCGATGGGGGNGGLGTGKGGDGTGGTAGSGGPGSGGTSGSGACYSTAATGTGGGTVVLPGSNGSPGGVSAVNGSLTSAGLYTPAVAPKGTDGGAGGSGGGGGGGGGRARAASAAAASAPPIYAAAEVALAATVAAGERAAEVVSAVVAASPSRQRAERSSSTSVTSPSARAVGVAMARVAAVVGPATSAAPAARGEIGGTIIGVGLTGNAGGGGAVVQVRRRQWWSWRGWRWWSECLRREQRQRNGHVLRRPREELLRQRRRRGRAGAGASGVTATGPTGASGPTLAL
ncbi:MAG: DUF1565 domain-containing protein [Myxococcales bacterium]|nr:DUF1565 domain-containing protein [Myxococcales bacterium]